MVKMFDALLQVRFLADLVNCRVVVVASLLSLLDNFVEVTMEDNIPQVGLKFWFILFRNVFLAFRT